MNLLYIAQSIEDIAGADRARCRAASMRGAARARGNVLFEAREARPRPHLDDKVIAAVERPDDCRDARGRRAQLVDSPRRRRVARRPPRARAEFVRERVCGSRADRAAPAPLSRRRGRPSTASARTTPASRGASSSCSRRRATAAGSTGPSSSRRSQTELFFDPADGGWFSTTGDDPSVLLRLKEDYDGAEPAAASVTVRNLIRSAHLAGDAALLDRARRTLERYGPGLGQRRRA